MSISDLIVVMESGVVQQIGKPQEVYDQPVNLFVAKFLGTPPINTFRASVKGSKLYIGSEAVLDAPGVADGSVIAAVRPEGFIPDSAGALTTKLSAVEVMGRDITVVSTHPDCENAVIRSIVSSGTPIDAGSEKQRFFLKPEKVSLFCPETGTRLL